MTKQLGAWLDSRQAFRMVQIVALVALVLSVYVGVKQYRLASCLASYNDRSAKATAARTVAAERDRNAQDAMWQAFADAGDPQKVPPAQASAYAKAAFEKFLKDRAQANEQRAKNPLPAPPSQVCH